MTVTVGKLTKNVEKMFESLTPVEKARYISKERWRIADEVRTGKNVIGQEADLETIQNRFIMPMGAVDFIQYSQELYNLDTLGWTLVYIRRVIEDLQREDTLLHLVISVTNRECNNLYKKPKERGKSWQSDYKLARDRALICWKRRCQIKIELDSLLKSDFWDKNNLERPRVEPNPDLEKFMEWSMKHQSFQ
jgi:hypothetical protein